MKKIDNLRNWENYHENRETNIVWVKRQLKNTTQESLISGTYPTIITKSEDLTITITSSVMICDIVGNCYPTRNQINSTARFFTLRTTARLYCARVRGLWLILWNKSSSAVEPVTIRHGHTWENGRFQSWIMLIARTDIAVAPGRPSCYGGWRYISPTKISKSTSFWATMLGDQ